MPENFEPERGSLVYDKVKQCVAEVMEADDVEVTLRRPNGGVEWSRPRADVRRPSISEELSPRVAQVNHDSDAYRFRGV